MPIFEYRCQDCHATFEQLFLSTEKELPMCAKCGSKNVKRLLSNFGFRMVTGSTMSAGAEANCGGCSAKNCSSCHH